MTRKSEPDSLEFKPLKAILIGTVGEFSCDLTVNWISSVEAYMFWNNVYCLMWWGMDEYS